MGLYDFTFYDLIARNARSFNNRPAWLEADDGRALTYGQFKEAVDRLASGLQQAGVKKGDRIGVLGKNNLEFFLLYGAAAALGAIVLPVNWRLSPEEVLFNLNDGGPKLLFAGSGQAELVEKVRDRLDSVKDIYNLDINTGSFCGIETLLDNTGGFAPADVAADDGFVIIHTAAVAGRPRGALLSHGNLLCANLTIDYYLEMSAKTVHLSLLPLFHVGGLFMATASFQAGAHNISMSKFDAGQAVALIERHQVSMLFEFAPILAAILEAAEKNGAPLKSLKCVGGLDAPDTIEKYQEMTGGTFFCMYGQTETSCAATMGRYDEKPGSAGKTVPLGVVQLVDDHDRPVATGDTGEITMRGPMVFKGYWNLPEDNAYTFRGGWHHTGDLGRFDEDGFLWYAGRKPEKELIKPGGENVYPAEVEKVILQHPAVAETVVFGVPDPKWKEGIKAVCCLEKGESLTPEALIDFVGERIARFKKPGYVEFVDAMPVLEDGSPDRETVKKQYGGEQ
ncbi:MAG: AMP-binding protein [Deltaproteobacteria bacterium]|nr:AMP-binding protein [Deltaproteobacteria bacterium]